MPRNTCWLPPKCKYDSKQENWESYEDKLYQIFTDDFINRICQFMGKDIRLCFHPIRNYKAETFNHIISKEEEKGSKVREVNILRCERIAWIRAIIENHDCNPDDCIIPCDGVKVWKNKKKRYHLLFEKERYLVVLEDRGSFMLLITAFYLEYDNAIRKRRKEYEKYLKQKTPC